MGRMCIVGRAFKVLWVRVWCRGRIGKDWSGVLGVA